MGKKRRFGRVRRLPSGRIQARYPGPDGVDRPAPETFATKAGAEIWLNRKEAEILSGTWIDPAGGKVPFRDYASAWIRDRVLKATNSRPIPGPVPQAPGAVFGNFNIGDIREADVRRWRKDRLEAGPSASPPYGPVTVAKPYRLLHTVLSTAADDRLIRRNPCRIKGAGEEHSPERPIVPLPTLMELLDAIPIRYRALLLLATFASLRFGELAALRRCDLDLTACTVRVVRSTAEMDDGRLIDDDPKSHAGRRVIAIPREIVPELRWHLERFAEPADEGLVFVGPLGGRLRWSNFRDLWIKTRGQVGLPGLHLHDLRHTGNTMAAATGASLRELMERMGHSSTRAAMIYQHATRERDEAIAAAMGAALTQARHDSGKSRSGTQRARKRGSAS